MTVVLDSQTIMLTASIVCILPLLYINLPYFFKFAAEFCRQVWRMVFDWKDITIVYATIAAPILFGASHVLPWNQVSNGIMYTGICAGSLLSLLLFGLVVSDTFTVLLKDKQKKEKETNV